MRNLYKMLTAICLLAVTPAAAEESRLAPLPDPVSFIGQYYFSWAGLHLGDLELSIAEKPESYEVRLAVTSAGVVNWFTKHEDDTVVRGRREGGSYHPSYYESFYKTKNKPRHIRLQFNDSGALTETLNEPPENRALRPEVPATLTNGALDPLSAMMRIRQGISLSFHAFDAKRLYNLLATPGADNSMSILGKEISLKDYILSRQPLGGLTDKEKKDYEAGEPPLHFYLSGDARHIPVYVTMPIFMGSVKGILTKECKTWEECKVK